MTLTPRQIAHKTFIKSPEWKAIRLNLLRLRGKKCEVCGSKNNIQVHHLNYKRFGGNELTSDLKILCGKHHQKTHGLSPKINKKKKNERGLGTYKQILIDKYQFSKKGKGWKRLAVKLSRKLNAGFTTFSDGNEAREYVVAHIESLGIDINTVKVIFDKKVKPEAKKEFKPKVILRKK